ncbi:MAG: energy transducer TonB [Acidobacteriota bacterium]
MFRRFRIKPQTTSILIFVVVFAFLMTIFGSVQPLFGQSRQLSLADILIALRSKKAEIDEKNRILADAVKERGITFALTPEIEKELDSTGARTDLIAAIRSKAISPPESIAEMRKAEPVKPEIIVPKPVPPPQDFAFFRLRAAENLKSGDMAQAIADLGKALEFKPVDTATLLDRGSAYAKQGKSELAFSDLDKVIELDAKNAAAFLARAQLFEKEGKIERAVADYDKSVEFDTSNESAKISAAKLRNQIASAAKKSEPVVSPVEKSPAPVEKSSPPAVLSVGPLNPYATELATPTYSAMDRRMNIFGRVTVEIELDETGKVVTAKATDGARSLRVSAEEAVRKSKFRPVKSGTVPVKATGFIIFNFVNQ